MIDWLFILVPVAWLCCFAGIFYLVGAALNGWIFKLELGPAKFFIFSVLGISYTILLCHLLLALQLFYAPLALILILTPVLITIPKWQIPSPSSYKSHLFQHFGLLLIILIYFLPESFAVFIPEHLHDAIAYHLSYTKDFANNHGLVLNPYLRYPLNALNFDLLFSLGFLFEGEILARLFNVYSTLLLVIGIYVFCCSHLNKLAGLLAAWAFCDIEMVTSLMVAGYIDLGLTLFIFSAIFMLLIQVKQNQQNKLYLSAVFFGIALGAKYLALLILPMYLLWTWARSNTRTCWKVALIVIIIGCPWYIRNIWVSGNPIHPFAQQWFGFWLWTEADLVTQQKDLLAHHGIEQSLAELIKLPYLFLDNAFNKHGSVNFLVVMGMVLAPIGLTIKGVIRQISVFSLVNIIFWFFSSQIARYLLYVFPFLVIISAYFISKPLLTIMTIFKRPTITRVLERLKFQHIIGPLLWLLILASGYKSFSYFQKISQHNLIVSNPKQWQSKLMQKPAYQLAMMANQQAKQGTFLLCKEALQLYFDGPVKGDWYGVANMSVFVKNVLKSDLATVMQKHHVDMLLVEKQFHLTNELLPLINRGQFELIAENDFGQLFKLSAK